MKTLEELARRWLEEAALLERYRDHRGAEVCKLHAAELQAALESHEDELLDLRRAAEVSGYSTDHLRHLVADGTIPNAGRKGSPKVRRSDLPVKPGRAQQSSGGGFDPASEAVSILRRAGRGAA